MFPFVFVGFSTIFWHRILSAFLFNKLRFDGWNAEHWVSRRIKLKPFKLARTHTHTLALALTHTYTSTHLSLIFMQMRCVKLKKPTTHNANASDAGGRVYAFAHNCCDWTYYMGAVTVIAIESERWRQWIAVAATHTHTKRLKVNDIVIMWVCYLFPVCKRSTEPLRCLSRLFLPAYSPFLFLLYWMCV